MRHPCDTRPATLDERACSQWKREAHPTLPGLLALLTLALALAGCDLFATREFSHRPESIRPLVSIFAGADSVVFQITESLRDSASNAKPAVLARKRVRFRRAPESAQPGGDWTAVDMRVTYVPSGQLIEEGRLRLRQDAQGLAMAPALDSAGVTLSGGARYHPLKMAASAALSGAPASPEAVDSVTFLIFPPAFSPDHAWIQSLGVLDVVRVIEDVDTLNYRGRLEESWRVSESVLDGGRALSRGRSWYGSSGLLKAEQAWSIEARGVDGAAEGTRELLREVSRL